jgi:hypothetical protein
MDKTMDNAQKHNTCNNIPSSLTFRDFLHPFNIVHLSALEKYLGFRSNLKAFDDKAMHNLCMSAAPAVYGDRMMIGNFPFQMSELEVILLLSISGHRSDSKSMLI